MFITVLHLFYISVICSEWEITNITCTLHVINTLYYLLYFILLQQYNSYVIAFARIYEKF